MNLSIRFAGKDDFNLVRAFDPHSSSIDQQKIRVKIEANEILLAFDDQTPVGIIRFSYFWSTKPYMDLIWVTESYRGKQIGKQLLQFLESYLVEQGYTYLYTSSQENELAPQQWHEHQGFERCGVLSALNLPQADINEVFFYKHLVKKDPVA